jgi:hypothetical protein
MTTLEIDENSHTSTSYIPTFYSGILSELNLGDLQYVHCFIG